MEIESSIPGKYAAHFRYCLLRKRGSHCTCSIGDVERKREPEHQAQMKWARDMVSNIVIPPACENAHHYADRAKLGHVCPDCGQL